MAQLLRKMETKTDKNWIDAMIRRESTPKALREGTISSFCSEWGVDESTYYYQSRKKDNQKKIIDIWLSEAVKGGNEVLQKLKENAKEGKEKSIEMYLKFVLELKDRMDITSNDDKITEMSYATAKAIIRGKAGQGKTGDTDDSE